MAPGTLQSEARIVAAARHASQRAIPSEISRIRFTLDCQKLRRDGDI
jgi:hypothetical protein